MAKTNAVRAAMCVWNHLTPEQRCEVIDSATSVAKQGGQLVKTLNSQRRSSDRANGTANARQIMGAIGRDVKHLASNFRDGARADSRATRENVDADSGHGSAPPAAPGSFSSPDELPGPNGHATIHYRHKTGTPFPAHECPLLRPLVTGDTSTSELDWFVRRDGSMFPVAYVSSPLEMRDGRGAVVAFTDVEDRLLLEEVLGEPDATLAAQHAALRDELARLADEQAALRRAAMLVARGIPPRDLLAGVAREVGLLVGGDTTHIGRYEAGGTATLIASWSRTGGDLPMGMVAPIDGQNVCSLVLRTGRPARMNSYEDASGPIAAMLRELGVRSSVGAPIVVDGRRWGVAIVSSKGDQPLSADTEERIAAFTELVATAISNTATQRERARLADEQAALRRVATLVAQGVPASEVFATVGEEVRRLLRVASTSIMRFEEDATAIVVARSREAELRVGDRLSLEGESVTARVFRTGRPARLDDYSLASGGLGTQMREAGIRSAVGAPIVVEGRLWGAIVAGTRQDEPLPTGVESRIGEFTELLATAISNVQAWSDLAASRARIVAAADEERRRVVRDLHDGAQQRLVHTVITLKLACQALKSDEAASPELVTEALEQAERATAELRELAHGILPAVLTSGGLRAGVEALASRTPVPVDLDITNDRLPAPIEATAYFVVAEALTNVAKHARAGSAAVSARIADGTLAVRVRDDGVGGARREGSGLLGLADRLAALDGTLRVETPAGGGTLIAAAIPISPKSARSRDERAP